MKGKDRGTFDCRVDSDSEVIVCRWVDDSVVTVVSNARGVEPHAAGEITFKRKKGKSCGKPAVTDC